MMVMCNASDVIRYDRLSNAALQMKQVNRQYREKDP